MKNHYLFALLPPEGLARQIHEIRLACSEKFGVIKALKPPVHITLYRPFHMEDTHEEYLIREIASATSGMEPFEQFLENFEAFDTKAVVIRALKNPGIIALHSSISSVLIKNELDKIKPGSTDQPFRPHLTIAYRDISPAVFPLIWEEYKDMKFKRSFNADHFSLLKHDGIKWNLHNNFFLGSA